MRRTRLLLALLVIGTSPAFAEEIIYFTNGTYMGIRAHTVDGNMIRVDMGESNFMAFPFEVVEKIVDGGKDVLLRPSTGVETNRMLGIQDLDGSYPVRGQRPAKRATMGWEGEKGLKIQENDASKPLGTDEHGMATFRPFAGQGGAKSRFQVTGHERVFGAPPSTSREEGLLGSTRVGNRFVLPGKDAPRRRAGVVITGDALAEEPPAAPPPPEPEPEGGGASAEPEE